MAQSTRMVVLRMLYNINLRAVKLKNHLIFTYTMGHTATYCPRVINALVNNLIPFWCLLGQATV